MDTTAAVKNQLSATLLGQDFSCAEQNDSLLAAYKEMAESYAKIDHSVVVLSDFQSNRSYIYAGNFGKVLGLNPGNSMIDSSFEEAIFSKIHPDDLIERHVLELSFFQYQKKQVADQRQKYSTSSRIRISNSQGGFIYTNHRIIYLNSLPNDSVWLSLCVYAPSTYLDPHPGIDGKIINNETGENISFHKYRQFGKMLITKREIEILGLVAKGMSSKQIAGHLHITEYTVRRHRQNLIYKMQVSNASEAVKTAMIMGLI